MAKLSISRLALVSVACVTLMGCGKGKEPTGQVVATVDGEEITLTELRAELEGANLPDPKARKAAEQQALQMIINRKIIANAATKQKLDRTPEFAVQESRAMDALRANSLQKKVLDSVPEPTREEANRYMAANPNMFAQRKIFIVDQMRIAMPTDPKVMAEFQPLKTFEDVENFLKARGMNYQRGTDRIDALGANPKLVDAIAALPPGEVFVVPAGRVALINRVRETRVEPFTGEAAIKHAIGTMKNQRSQDAVAKQFGGLIKQAQATVKYNAQYQPAPAKAPAGKADQPPAKAAQPAPKA